MFHFQANCIPISNSMLLKVLNKCAVKANSNVLKTHKIVPSGGFICDTHTVFYLALDKCILFANM